MPGNRPERVNLFETPARRNRCIVDSLGEQFCLDVGASRHAATGTAEVGYLLYTCDVLAADRYNRQVRHIFPIWGKPGRPGDR